MISFLTYISRSAFDYTCYDMCRVEITEDKKLRRFVFIFLRRNDKDFRRARRQIARRNSLRRVLAPSSFFFFFFLFDMRPDSTDMLVVLILSYLMGSLTNI